MKLDIVVIQNSKNPNLERLSKSLESIENEGGQCIRIDNIEKIPYEKIQTEYWMIFYDNEEVSKNLNNALFLLDGFEFDYWTFYVLFDSKKISKYPRMFKRGIELQILNEKLYPVNHENGETLLDGWIFSHDESGNRQESTQEP